MFSRGDDEPIDNHDGAYWIENKRLGKLRVEIPNFQVGDTRELIVRCLSCKKAYQLEIANVLPKGAKPLSNRTLPKNMFEMASPEGISLRRRAIFGLVLGVIVGAIGLTLYFLGKSSGLW